MQRTTEKRRRLVTGWLAYCDIYGFGAEITSSNLTALTKRLLAFQKDLKRISASNGLVSYMFSDSVIIFIDDHSNGRDKGADILIDLLRTIQNKAHSRDFFLRGAVFHGKMSLSTTSFIGEPLLLAARLEERLSLPFIVVPDSELNPNARHFSKPYTLTNVPTKSGLIGAHVILPGPLTPLMTTAAEQAHKYLRTGPDHVAQVWVNVCKFLDQSIAHSSTNNPTSPNKVRSQ